MLAFSPSFRLVTYVFAGGRIPAALATHVQSGSVFFNLKTISRFLQFSPAKVVQSSCGRAFEVDLGLFALPLLGSLLSVYKGCHG